MICIALDSELNIDDVICKLDVARTYELRGTSVYVIDVNRTPVLLIPSGTTKVEIGNFLGQVLNKFPVTKLIGTGNTASLYPQRVKIGEPVIISSTLQYDVDFTGLGYGPAEIPGLNKTIFAANGELVEVAIEATRNCGYEEQVGRCLSADRWLANEKVALQLRSFFKGNFVDTECGAFGEIGFINEIPFVAVKGVSNYANANAAKDWKRNYVPADLQAIEIALEMANLLTCSK